MRITYYVTSKPLEMLRQQNKIKSQITGIRFAQYGRGSQLTIRPWRNILAVSRFR